MVIDHVNGLSVEKVLKSQRKSFYSIKSVFDSDFNLSFNFEISFIFFFVFHPPQSFISITEEKSKFNNVKVRKNSDLKYPHISSSFVMLTKCVNGKITLKIRHNPLVLKY